MMLLLPWQVLSGLDGDALREDPDSELVLLCGISLRSEQTPLSVSSNTYFCVAKYGRYYRHGTWSMELLRRPG